MQDSNLKYSITVEGAEGAVGKFELVGAAAKKAQAAVAATGGAAGGASGAIRTLGDNTGRAADQTNRASRSQAGYFGHIARTTVQSAIINKLFLEFVDVSGQAIQNVDLMNNFPATMASMGQSTKEAGEAFQDLRDYVGQVGGNLGNAVSLVTRFTGVTNDVKAATAIYQGLNNALIAGDTTLEEQKNAAIQFGQALERGKPDMREWNTLSTVMSQQLGIVAENMGYVNANQLGQALRDGEESMSKFTTELTKVSTGSGEVAMQAYARMNGMQFAFNVMKNTMVQGVATIINSLGRSNIVAFFTFLTQVIQVLTGWVLILINFLGGLANIISRLFGGGDVFKKVTGDVTAAADSMAGGADSAKDLGDGLKGAKKDAKELNKSLASFDKMNVLADKTSGKGDKDDEAKGGGTNFDAGQLAELGDLSGGMNKGLEEASKWAKIFAGILTGIVGTMLLLKGIRWFNDTVDNIQQLNKNLSTMTEKAKGLGKTLADSFKGAGDEADKSGQKMSEKFAGALGKGAGSMSTAVAGFVGGVAGAIGTALGPALAGVATAIVGAISGIVVAGAAALGVSVGVFVAIIAAVVLVIIGIIYLIWTNWDTIWGWIKMVFTAFWDFLVSAWNTLYDIFSGPIKFLLQFWEAAFILVIAIIAIALELMFKLVVGTITLIYNVLKAIAGWVFENVIKPVGDFFVALWKGIVDGVTAAWQWIFEKILRPVATWVNTNVVQPVLGFFKSLWDTVSGFVSGFAAKVREFLSPLTSWIKINIIDRISGFFSGLWDGIKNGLSNMLNGLRSIFGSIGDIFKVPINGIIDLLNKALQGFNKIKVPDWVPGVGGKGVNFPMIPKLAQGGIVERATLAMIGENGQEAVVPLENNTEWIEKLADRINSTTGGSNQPVQLIVQIGEDKVASKVIDLINEKTQMSGRNMIYV